MARAIMIQGTGSNVGKSMLVAGLARAIVNRGLSVAPFKPQNMSNNAAVTSDGGEIGRAQALQARAARRAPTIDMNPVLLKPQTEHGSQVIVQGKPVGTMAAREYAGAKARLLPRVMESFARLSASVDLVLVEGAGSPAEINLRHGDIANMGFAEAADCPVILIGDIDRGGVIAQCAGTHAVLPPADRNRIKGFAINKFRGDVTLFADGVAAIEHHTAWPSLGVVPWFDDAWRLPPEDSLDLRGRARQGGVTVAVPRIGRIANFDDLDPLAAEPGVDLVIVEPGTALPGDAALVLIPGSKSTIADLATLRREGWDIDIRAHVRRGGHVMGLCGGYQMLGREIADPDGVEGPPAVVAGLGLLDIATRMRPAKHLALTHATHVDSGLPVEGYEIHVGLTDGPDCARPLLDLGERFDGATAMSGRVAGCYLHGLFADDAFRAWYLSRLGASAGDLRYEDGVEDALDALAAHVEAHLDVDAVLAIAGLSPDRGC